MSRPGIRVLLFLMLPLAAFAGASSSVSPASAATITVSTCDATVLGNAIANAAPGDTITFDCSGTLLMNIGNAYRYRINKDLTIDGTGQDVTFDGENASSVLYMTGDDTTLTLKGLKFTRGRGGSYGFCPGCGYVDFAGVITQQRGTLNIIDSTFSSNSSTTIPGGGAILSTLGTLNVTNSTFSNNDAYGSGGAIQGELSTLNVSNSTFSNNVTRSNGGAIGVISGEVRISGSTFTGNVANAYTARGAGGAVSNTGTMTVTNSTFSGNTAEAGGAIANSETLTVIHSTLVGNHANLWGNGVMTGVRAGIALSGGGTTTLTNTILANADVPTRGSDGAHPYGANCSGPGTIVNGGGNLADDDKCGISPVATTNLRLDPLADNGGPTQTIALRTSSAAINAATCLASATTDQRGYSRPATGLTTCDAGAYEAGAVSPIQTTALSAISGSGIYLGTATLTATLAVGGTGVAGKSITFTINGTGVGSATTGSDGVATLSGVSLAGIAAGSYPGAIGVSFAGDATHAASSGSGTLTVGQAAATITLDASTLTQTYDGSPRVVTATTTPADLSYSVSYNGSTTPPTDTGSYAVVATITSPNYTGSISGTLTVNKANQTITVVTPPPAGASYGDTFTVAATSDSGLPVSVSGSGACSNGGATFTMTGSSGPCTVEFTQAGNSNVNAASPVVMTVTASKAEQTVTFTSTAPTSAAYGDTYTPTATGGGSGNPVTIDASGACAYDSGSGVITMIAVGTCTVTADQAGDTNYVEAAQELQTFSVARASLGVAANNVTMIYGDAVPVFDATVTGLANGDSFATLGGTCRAEVDGGPVTSTTAPGSYPAAITCSGVNTTNYIVSYTPGTLTVNKAPEFTSANAAVFNVDEPDSFTVTTSGHPAATFTVTGTLPNGVSLSGAGVLSGTPTEVGVFVLTIVASNGVAPDAQQSFTLTVVVPEVIAPDDITVSNDLDQAGAVVTYPPATSIGNVGEITCTPGSGSFFPIGMTTVTCSSASGIEDTFTITVLDSQHPSLIVPANVSVLNTPGQDGAVVTYSSPVASDNAPGVTVDCDPLSGTFFPIGTTTVTCTATDVAGNVTTATFTITVEPSTQYLLDGLREDTVTLVTNPTAERALLTTLDRVQQYVNARNPLMAYLTMIQYVVQVEQQVNAKRITPTAARQLLEQAQVLVRSIV